MTRLSRLWVSRGLGIVVLCDVEVLRLPGFTCSGGFGGH